MKEDKSLCQHSSEGRARPLVGPRQVDAAAVPVLLHPADSLDESHGPRDLMAASSLANDFDDRFGDVLETHGSGDRPVVSGQEVCNAVKDLNPDPGGDPDHWCNVHLLW